MKQWENMPIQKTFRESQCSRTFNGTDVTKFDSSSADVQMQWPKKTAGIGKVCIELQD